MILTTTYKRIENAGKQKNSLYNFKNKKMETEIKDPDLWKAAKKRVAFKYMVLIYFIMNVFYWAIAELTFRNNGTAATYRSFFPWPAWPMLVWGLGIFIYYLMVFKKHHSITEKEYNKLKDKQ